MSTTPIANARRRSGLGTGWSHGDPSAKPEGLPSGRMRGHSPLAGRRTQLLRLVIVTHAFYYTHPIRSDPFPLCSARSQLFCRLSPVMSLVAPPAGPPERRNSVFGPARCVSFYAFSRGSGPKLKCVLYSGVAVCGGCRHREILARNRPLGASDFRPLFTCRAEGKHRMNARTTPMSPRYNIYFSGNSGIFFRLIFRHFRLNCV